MHLHVNNMIAKREKNRGFSYNLAKITEADTNALSLADMLSVFKLVWYIFSFFIS
jgi:hypothetical protein